MIVRAFTVSLCLLFLSGHLFLESTNNSRLNNGRILKSTIIQGAGDERVNTLLSSGYSVDTSDERKRTPLHWAAIWARPEEAEALLARNANVMAKDYQGNTPLHFAVQFDTNLFNRMKVIEKLLFYGADIYEQNVAGYSPIDLAISYFFTKMLLSFGVKGVLS